MFRASLLFMALPLAATAEPGDFLRDIAQIAALERLRIAAATDEPDALTERLDAERPLVLARLRGLDPDAAAALEAAGDPAAVIAAADAGQAALEADGAAPAPQRQAGVIATLLLPEGGVAEAYEEGAEGEAEEWAVAHHGLARVRVLTDALLADLPQEAGATVTAALERLEAAIPATPPAYAQMLPGGEIEFETQVIGATLLSATGAPGWPGADLPGTADLVAEWVKAGCADADAARGQETIAIAAFWHEDALSGALSLFAPAPQERIEATFDAIAAEGPGPVACGALSQALAEARPMVGG